MKPSMTTKKFPVKMATKYFTNIVKGLNMRESTGNINFENEESCKKIKEKFVNKIFSFEIVSTKDVLNLIIKLPGIKDIVSNDIPVSLFKEYVSTCCKKLANILNPYNCSTFPETREKAEATPVFKKVIPHQKTDYRPVNNLSVFSKFFEKLVSLQLNSYMQNSKTNFQITKQVFG